MGRSRNQGHPGEGSDMRKAEVAALRGSEDFVSDPKKRIMAKKTNKTLLLIVKWKDGGDNESILMEKWLTFHDRKWLILKRPLTGRAEKTINHYFGILKSLFFYAIKKYKLKIENPVCDVTYYITDRKRKEYTPQEIKRILDACEKIEKTVAPHALIMKYAKRITLMLLYTAMRPGELYKLRWDKHIKDDKIVLERTETKQRKGKVIPIN